MRKEGKTEPKTEPISQYKEVLINKMLQKGVSAKDISEILQVSEQAVQKNLQIN